MIERYWRDDEGKVHAERAVWVPALPDDPRATVVPADLAAQSEAGGAPVGQVVLSSVADPAPSPDQLRANPSALYDLDLPAGRTLIDADTYQADLAAEQAMASITAEQAQADLAAATDTATSTRAEAIEAFAAAAGVDPAVTQRLLEVL